MQTELGKRRRRGRALWCMVALMLCSACGDDDAGGLVPPPDAGMDNDAGDLSPIAIADYCDALIEAACPAGNTCGVCREDGGAREYYETYCATSVTKVELGTLRYDAQAAAACVASVAELSCQFAIYQGRCADVFVGLVAPGAACTQRGDGECRDGYCDTSERCPGVCVAWRGVDQSCDNEEQQCGEGLYCDEDKCKRRLPAGLSCDNAPGACGDELQCLAPTEGDPRVCTRLGDEGDDCEDDQGCAWTLTCDDGVCRARVARGDRCRQARNCPDGDQCYAAVQGEATRCAEPLDVGAVCSGDSNACASPASCQYGDDDMWRCRLPAEEGESCAHVSCMPPLICIPDVDGGHCGDTFDNGTACESNYYCQSGNCREGLCAGPGDEGDACESSGQSMACAEGLYCKREIDSGEGQCVARERAGESCLDQARFGDSVCAEDFHCTCTLDDITDCYDSMDVDAWECRALLSNGDDCRENAACESQACIGGKCKAMDDLSAHERFCVEEQG